MKDFLLRILEKYSAKINLWALNKRWKVIKEKPQTEWGRGYRKWKKKDDSKT